MGRGKRRGALSERQQSAQTPRADGTRQRLSPIADLSTPAAGQAQPTEFFAEQADSAALAYLYHATDPALRSRIEREGLDPRHDQTGDYLERAGAPMLFLSEIAQGTALDDIWKVDARGLTLFPDSTRGRFTEDEPWWMTPDRVEPERLELQDDDY